MHFGTAANEMFASSIRLRIMSITNGSTGAAPESLVRGSRNVKVRAPAGGAGACVAASRSAARSASLSSLRRSARSAASRVALSRSSLIKESREVTCCCKLAIVARKRTTCVRSPSAGSRSPSDDSPRRLDAELDESAGPCPPLRSIPALILSPRREDLSASTSCSKAVFCPRATMSCISSCASCPSRSCSCRFAKSFSCCHSALAAFMSAFSCSLSARVSFACASRSAVCS